MEDQIKKFDLIVIGTGPAGYLSAILSAQKGLSTAIIEKRELGGTCLNRGCIPTKALLQEAFLWEAFDKSGLIRNREEVTASFRKAMERKDAAVQQVVSGLRNLLNRDRITLFQGEVSFLNPRTVAIKREGRTVGRLEADRILIASGAVPKDEKSLVKDGERVIGSDEVLKMTDLPSSLAVVGGGRRGLEFATFFNAFGVPVTLIEKENRILPKMDREISVRYRSFLAKRNIKVLTEAEVISVEGMEKKVGVTVVRGGTKERLEAHKVLIVGERRGNTDDLDLDRASIPLRDGFIPVDSHMRTPTAGIYAAGDVTGKEFYAHKAFYEGKIAVENMLGRGSEVDYRTMPRCLYAYPEAASVGLSEEEAVKEYGELMIGKFPFMACGRSIAAAYSEGMVKIIAEKKYGEILGVHILGPNATELIHLGVMAMKHEIGVEEIKEMTFAHPTFSEAFFEAALDTHGEAIHMIKA